MAYPAEQIEELRPYCKKVSALTEGGGVFLHLEELRLPEECEPAVCDGLLRPLAGPDGYPSQLCGTGRVCLRSGWIPCGSGHPGPPESLSLDLRRSIPGGSDRRRQDRARRDHLGDAGRLPWSAGARGHLPRSSA